MDKSHHFWRNFRIRIVLIILFVTLLLSIGLYYLLYNQYYNLMIDTLRKDGYVIHQYAEQLLDIDSFRQLNTIEDEQSELYQQKREELDHIRRISNIKYLYTAKMNENGEYIYVLDGLDPSDEHFRHIGDLIEEDFVPTLQRCMENEIVTGSEILVTEWGYLYATYFPVHDLEGDGSVIGVIGMEFDCEDLYFSISQSRSNAIMITLLCMIAFTLTAAIALSRVMNQAQAELDEKDRLLVAAREEALKHSKAKGDFLSRMSHELRTPMNAIIGMTQIAQETNDLAKLQNCLSTIGTSSIQLMGLINDVLDMTKIEEGQFDIYPVPFNLEKLLLDSRNLVLDQIERRNQNFEIKIAEGINMHYVGDELKITQVITNFLTNAIKFTPDNGKITLTVHEIPTVGENTSTLYFSVIDTGIGMYQPQIDKLRTMFRQGSGSITQHYGGTGIGLAICKSIVEKMGGNISVGSELGKGSKFSFDILLECLPRFETLDANLTKNLSKAKEPLPDFSGITVLLVEDIDVNRDVFIALLESTHITVETADNGYDAVIMFKIAPEKYNLIVMDIQMPVMDGYAATKAIRAINNPWAKKVPIIALTAYAFKEDIDRCLASGMNDHIAKPIDREGLIRKFLKYIVPVKDGRK